MRGVSIQGPVLLLMGPIGSFFARLGRHLERRGVPVWKLSFPLHEFGFKVHQRLPFAGSMDEFKPFLRQLIEQHGIRHLFMYGDFLDPHRLAIELVEELNQNPVQPYKIEAWVFELGYIRPNYVSLELDRVNARSSLNKNVEFYQSLDSVDLIPQARRETGIRWRKWWKAPTFIQHSLTSYPIIQGAHKLQPKPSYLFYQLRGLIRKFAYKFTEKSTRCSLMDGPPYFLVPLQVSSDSQISLGSSYVGMEPFIEEMISSFAVHASSECRLAFKHHPRDRGYNHYGKLIRSLAGRYNIADRVLYFHDGALGPILKQAKGVVTINSTVGLQALYHAVPTKVLGKTFYNLPGLADQQALSDFWRDPQLSDRELFRKFYMYLIETTQINGNFDGQFPFERTFSIAPELAIHATGPSPGVLQVFLRLVILAKGFSTYYLQLLCLALGARNFARRLLEQTSRELLDGLGVRVLMDRRVEPLGRPIIHIANHGHPLDVLLVQGYFRECSMTTAAGYLRWILPFFSQSASNYGHTNLNHLCARSRREGMRKLLRVMQQKGRLFLFPSGSLVTPITERVSGSLHVLGRRSDALIIPWFSTYRGFSPHEVHLQYRPLAMILARLFGPQATILCQEGAPLNPRQFEDQNALSDHIRLLYRQRLVSLEHIV